MNPISNNSSRKRSLFSKRFAVLLIAIVVVLGGGYYIRHHSSSNNSISKTPDHPEYLSFASSYVFSIPTGQVVDERSIPGLQLIYTGELNAKTLEDVYSANGISVQAITNLSDHKTGTFKKYVTDTIVPDAKKNVGSDVQVKYGTSGKWATAKITVKKNGQQVRFIYLKNGNHPVAVVGKSETDAFKKIDQTITDVEDTDLKDANASIRQTTLTAAEQIKNQDAHSIYQVAATALKAKSSEADLAKALSDSAVYDKGNIVMDGGSYNSGGEFTVVINFTPLDKNIAPASGAITLKNENGWKVEALTLPTPKK